MATMQDVIRRVQIQATAQGVDQTTAALNKLADAESNVTVKQDAVSRSTLSVQSKLVNLQRQVDAEFRSEQNLAKAAATLSAARAQGLIDVQGQANLLGLAQQKYMGLTKATNDNTKAVGLNRIGMLELQASGINAFQALASGMSPLRVATMEGAQVIGAFIQGSNNLGATLVSIGEGFVSLLTPMNLMIAGVAALGAGAVLWLTHEHDKTVIATTSLQDHKKWLDQILAGYDDAKKAADAYLASAEKLPEAAVASNLQKTQQDRQKEFAATLKEIQAQADQYAKAIQQLRDIQSVPTLPGVSNTNSPLQQTIDQFDRVRQILSQVGDVSSMSKAQIDQMVVELTKVANSTADSRLSSIATSALDLVTQARSAKIEVGNLGDTLNNLPSSVKVIIDLQMAGYNGARKNLLDLMPDLRNQFDKARDEAKAAYSSEVGAAPDAILRQAAGSDYAKVLAGIDAAQKASELKHPPKAPKVDPYVKVTDALNLQLKALTETDRQKEIDQELSKAKVAASSKEGQAITDLAGKYYDQKKAIDDANQAAAFFAQTTESAFEGVITGSESVTDALGQMLKALAQAVIQAELLGSGPLAGILGTSPTTSGGAGGILGSIFKAIIPHANGGIQSGAGISAYSSSIVSSPTLFPFATGTGLMGEAGPEAIMPLKRGANGVLGVASDGGGGQPVHVTVGVSVDDNGNLQAYVKGVSQQATQSGIAQYDATLPQKVHRKAIAATTRPGAPIDRWAA